MTSEELKTIRIELGLSVLEMGRALGYQGTDDTASDTIRKYERGRDIPPWIARLAHMYQLHGIPDGFGPVGSGKYNEPEFHEWLESRDLKFIISYSRYGLLGGHGFVAAAIYDEEYELIKDMCLISEPGDIDAFDAAKRIDESKYLWVNHPNPATAMQGVVNKLYQRWRARPD